MLHRSIAIAVYVTGTCTGGMSVVLKGAPWMLWGLRPLIIDLGFEMTAVHHEDADNTGAPRLSGQSDPLSVMLLATEERALL